MMTNRERGRPLKELVKLEKEPRIKDELGKRVKGPDDLERAAEELGAPAYLLNFYMATPDDLSEIGLGKGIYIPVQIAKGKGGRKSLHFLRAGERVLQGIFVTSEELALKYVTRETGRGEHAETGDTYTEEITTLDGELVWKGRGKLEVIDAATGHAKLVLETEGGEDPLCCYWIFWSCIAWCARC